MQIEDGWIRSVRKRDLTDNKDDKNPNFGNATIDPKRIVLHYSAGSTLKGAVDTLRKRGLSYHVLIDVDGEPYQTRPFTIRASHAGRSNWKESAGVANDTSLNNDSIGISFINLGQLGYFDKGIWYYDYDRKTKSYLKPSVQDKDATKAAQIYTPGRLSHWTPFDPRQLAICELLLQSLLGRFAGIKEIIGHHDVAIDEKPDPGPLAPLEQWRKKYDRAGGLGFAATVKSPDGELILRDRPDVEAGKKIGVLKTGDAVHIRAIPYSSRATNAIILDDTGPRYLTPWASVDINQSNTHAGFVFLRYLNNSPLAASYKSQL